MENNTNGSQSHNRSLLGVAGHYPMQMSGVSDARTNSVGSSFHKKPIAVLYASETGTAEDIAFDLNDRINVGCNRVVLISSLDTFDVDLLPTMDTVIFVVSTTGDGEVPSSMKYFWNFILRRSLSADSLKGVRAAVFGLGDSSYEKYNAAARKLFRRLQQLGVEYILPLGLGDDQAPQGLMTQFRPWERSLHLKLQELGLSTGTQPPTTLMTNFTCEIIHTTGVDNAICDTNKCFIPRNSIFPGPIRCSVVTNSRLTRQTWSQDVRQVVLEVQTVNGDTQLDSFCYKPGHIATVQPKNDPSVVDRALALLRLGSPKTSSADISDSSIVSVRYRGDRKLQRPYLLTDMTCSVGALLGTHLDIQGIPRRSFFTRISLYATNEEEQAKLVELGSDDGYNLYYEYVVQGKRHYIDVLEDFRSCRPPLACWVDSIPRLCPRRYSIASSSALQHNRIELCVAVAKSRSKYGKTRIGTCSGYLSRVCSGEEVTLWIESGAISEANISVQKSVLLVGPGTGVAPIRSLVYERIIFQLNQLAISLSSPSDSSSDPSAALAEAANSLLAFGCRRRDSDFLYSVEWNHLLQLVEDITQNYATLTSHDIIARINQFRASYIKRTEVYNTSNDYEYSDCSSWPSASVLTALCAFSQETERKYYVTDALRDHPQLVWEIIRRDGVVVVSGTAKSMPKDVRAAIRSIIIDNLSQSQSQSLTLLSGPTQAAIEAEADKMMAAMEREKRYIVEAWS